MNLIIDTSVASKWFFPEPLQDAAHNLLNDDSDLFAPDFILGELANVAWKKATRGEIRESQAVSIVSGFDNCPLSLIPSAELVARATRMALELNHPVYDCLYLACAELVDGCVITADLRFERSVSKSPLRPLLQILA